MMAEVRRTDGWQTRAAAAATIVNGRLGWLRRRGWVLVASAVAVTIIVVAVSSTSTPTYTAEAIAVVPAGGGDGDPGNAGEANRLAITYASVIPEDNEIRKRLDAVAGDAADDGELTVFVDEDTAVVRIRYEHPNRRIAVRGVSTVARAISGPAPVSPAIASGSVILSRLPEEAERNAGPASTPVPIGILLGLFLGAVIVVAWERADSRVDDASTLAAETGTPVSNLGLLSAASAAAVLDRWRGLGRASPTRVALVPVRGDRTVGIAAALAGIGTTEGRSVAVGDTDPRAHSSLDGGAARLLDLDVRTGRLAPVDQHADVRVDVQLVPSGPPGGDEAGEAVAFACDVAVIVVPQGTRIAQVRNAVATLRQFGVAPAWALLVGPGSVRSMRRTADVGRAAEDHRAPASA